MARLHVPAARLTGPTTRVEGDAHKYLSRVLRLQPGDSLTLFDGEGGEVDARVVALDGQGTDLVLGARRAIPPAANSVTLLQAVAKGERMDFIVQKCTELGVTRIVPVLTERCVARPRGGETRHTRWNAIAREAARQCGRAEIPPVDAPLALAAALQALPPSIDARFVAWERCEERPLRRALDDPHGPHVALLIGPEGGLAAEEVAEASRAGFVSVGLGPHILRVETAAVVAVTLVQAAAGALD